MAKTQNLELVRDESPVQVEAESPHGIIAELKKEFSTVYSRLATIEVRLLQLEQMAHNEHHMELDKDAITAIGNALLPEFETRIVETLRSHLGISGLPARGDQ